MQSNKISKSGAEILKSSEKFRICLGLNRVQRMLELFSNPEKSISFIHVAGTNGKGSTCAIIEKILLEEGVKTIGKYTSPHLFSYTERFSVNGKNITEEEFDELVNLVYQKDIEEKIGLTEFEILTVVCFLYFKKMGVEIGILETGLGGRLDATNVIDNPLITVVTSISFDHKERLGDSIEKISKEKAGIFKKGSKCVFLKENKGYDFLLKEAELKGAKIIEDNLDISLDNGFCLYEGEKIPFSLKGDFQLENLKLALLAIRELPFEVSKNAIKKGLSSVKWKFRMEETTVFNKKVLLDGCHNPDGARVLANYINKYKNGKKIKLIFGCLSNKDYKSILDTLLKLNCDFYFYEFSYPNSLKYDNLGEFKTKFQKTENVLNEIKKGGADLFVVTGSLYMLGNVFKEIL